MAEPRHYPPRLYAEGQSNLENLDINHNVLFKHIVTFRDSVGETVWNQIKEHPTGIAAKIFERNTIWSGKTVHYLLCRQLRVRKKELWFIIGGQPIRFGLNEFEHVTGFNIDPLPTEPFEPEADYRAFFRELNVPDGAEGPTLYELIDGLDKCRAWAPQDSRRIWMGRLILIAIGIHAIHHNSRIPLESAKRVFDDEALNNYPWGRVAFQSLVESIQTLSPTGRTYTVNGLVYVLQAWAYESITCFGELFGNPAASDMRPLLRWRGNRTRKELGPVIDEEIEKHGKVTF